MQAIKAVPAVARRLRTDMPTGFQLKGHRWTRLVGPIRQEMDLRPMKSLRGLGPVWFRVQLAVDLGEHGSAALLNKTLGADGVGVGADLTWPLPTECDDEVIESAALSIRGHLPEVLAYFDRLSTPEQFLAALGSGASERTVEAQQVFERFAT